MFHLLVVAATALIASGGSALQSMSPAAGALSKVKAGLGILILAWIILIAMTAVTFLRRRQQQARSSRAHGSKVNKPPNFPVDIPYIHLLTFSSSLSESQLLSSLSASVSSIPWWRSPAAMRNLIPSLETLLLSSAYLYSRSSLLC